MNGSYVIGEVVFSGSFIIALVALEGFGRTVPNIDMILQVVICVCRKRTQLANKGFDFLMDKIDVSS